MKSFDESNGTGRKKQQICSPQRTYSGQKSGKEHGGGWRADMFCKTYLTYWTDESTLKSPKGTKDYREGWNPFLPIKLLQMSPEGATDKKGLFYSRFIAGASYWPTYILVNRFSFFWRSHSPPHFSVGVG